MSVVIERLRHKIADLRFLSMALRGHDMKQYWRSLQCWIMGHDMGFVYLMMSKAPRVDVGERAALMVIRCRRCGRPF